MESNFKSYFAQIKFSFKLGPLYPSYKSHLFTLKMRLDGSRPGVEALKERKNLSYRDL
jgi:hypothetical protein